MRKFTLLLVSLLLAGAQMLQAQRTITGTVISAEDNQGIPGVSVSVKGTTTGTTTDINGRYSLNVPNDGVSLVFNYVGMATQEIAVAGKNTVDVTMQSTATDLEGVVIVGYGTAKKIGTTVGSVAQVSSETIKDRPNANVMDALQGKVAGLQIYTSSGEPTQTSSVRLHGVGSLGASSTPLYILDGMPIDATAIRSFNPNDYESVTVLKDASATSIYGSRAANGVIYMTSKKGSLNQAATITVNAQTGFSSLANTDFHKIMNSAQLNAFWKEWYPGAGNAAVIDSWFAEGYDTKWQDVYFNDRAPMHQVDLSVAGGGGRTTYYISGSNYYQEGTAIGSSYLRNNLRSNIESTVNNWLKMGVNAVGAYAIRKTGSGFNDAYTDGGLFWLTEPFISPVDENGKRRDRITGSGALGYHPEYVNEKSYGQARDYRANTSAYIQLNPFEGFTLRSQAGIDARLTNGTTKRLPSFLGTPNNGRLVENYANEISRIITNTIEYKFNLDKRHFFTALIGQEATDYKYQFFQTVTSGQKLDQLMQLEFGDPTLTSSTSEFTENLYSSYFGRVDYAFNDKYYADFSVRNDASSRFGANNRSATFFSVGAMWNLKSESFMSGIKPITDLRLKAGYGTSGNSAIGDYDHRAYVSQTTNYNSEMAFIAGSLGNPDLSWETQKLLTVNLDAELYNRFRVNLEYYDRQTVSMLMNVPYPYTTGVSSRMENTASLKNYGFDITADVDILKGKDYYLNFNMNFNLNKSKVTELFDGKQVWIVPNTGVTYVVGKPVEFYYPLLKGVDPQDGRLVWYLPGEDNTVTQRDDSQVTKDFNEAVLTQSTGIARYAPMAGGFGLSGGWKGFSIQADFSFVLKKYIINNDRFFSENPNVVGFLNQSIRVTDFWKEPGDVKDYPDWRTGQIMQFDDHLIENASFLRLKNLTISYSLPRNLLSKTKFISAVRIYATSRNLLTFTKYTGPDPEIDSNLTTGAYPNSKQFTIGAEIKF